MTTSGPYSDPRAPQWPGVDPNAGYPGHGGLGQAAGSFPVPVTYPTNGDYPPTGQYLATPTPGYPTATYPATGSQPASGYPGATAYPAAGYPMAYPSAMVSGYPAPYLIPQPSNGLGTAGLVLGIIAVVFCWVPWLGVLLGVLTVIFGGVGIKKAKEGIATNRGSAIAGLVMGIIAIAVNVIFWIAVWSVIGAAVTSLDG